MEEEWKKLYQYSDAKGFPTASYSNSVKASKVPKRLFEQCIPKCIPIGATNYTESMIKCASNCKNKTIESYQIFKGIYEDKLTNDGYMLEDQTKVKGSNPFEGLKENTRLTKVMKEFEVHTAPASSNYM